MSSKKIKGRKMNRHRVRRLVVQILYQASFSSEEIITATFIDSYNLEGECRQFFEELLLGIKKHIKTLDQEISSVLDRELSSLQTVELSVLRLGVFELMFMLQTPHRVILNEAIELTKEFGAVEGYKYVNAVLDPLVKQLRKV